MQINNPEKLLNYIWSQNSKCKIIMGHTIFNPIVSLFFNPIKNYLIQSIPIINSIAGRALTLDDTEIMVKQAGGRIKYQKNIKNDRYIFICFYKN